jgi:hypothetical protein
MRESGCRRNSDQGLFLLICPFQRRICPGAERSRTYGDNLALAQFKEEI